MNPTVSMRQIARDMGRNDRCVRRIAKTELELKSYELRCVCGGNCARGKTPVVFVEDGLKINKKVYHRDILEAVIFLWAQKEMQTERFNKTLHQLTLPKRHKNSTRRIFQTYLKNGHPTRGSQSHGLQGMVHFGVQGLS
ncbi:hypothetical protein TNCV_3131271 [Trichonephila clavipes]|nr:hypothetical protein TNCV_3131271 [Trichonephila clavipes]